MRASMAEMGSERSGLGARPGVRPGAAAVMAGRMRREVAFAPYWSLQTGLRAEAWRLSRAARFARPGFLLIALFEITCMAISVHVYPTLSAKALPFELFNLFAGFVCLSFTWTLFFDYHWRATVFGLCAMILVAATSVGLLTGRTEPLFMSMMLLMVGAGSLVPWDGRWQAALTALCMVWLAINAIWVPVHSDNGLYPWLGLLAAAGLAHLATAMKDRYQKDLRSEVETLAAELVRAHSA
jgi:hypothetical protein